MGNLGCTLLHAVILVVLRTSYVVVASGKITDPAEVHALMAVKGSLVDPTNNLKNWGRGDPCTSNWTGIFCVEIPSDEYLHVAKIQLFEKKLSGSLAREVGLLSQLETLDFMWNSLTGSIPKEVGNIKMLSVLTLNGNQLSGSLPDEIGNLLNLNRLQIDQNHISGPIPKSFANLTSVKHIHMNNNSLSGQIRPELSRLPALLHLLVDNNNLSGPLPPELAEMPSLQIFQADNNNFNGTSIPAEYSNIRTLLKLSLRNCSLQGVVPDLSNIPALGYLDLSWNKLKGSIPTNKLPSSITTIDLSHNFLNGTIPSNISGLSYLQLLSVEGNLLHGAVSSAIWSNISFTGTIVLNLQNNSFDSIPAVFEPPEAVTVLLYGNPVCSSIPARATNLCHPGSVDRVPYGVGPQFGIKACSPCPTDTGYEQNPVANIPCFCAVPLGVGFRLKSPGISDFRPYKETFEMDLKAALDLDVVFPQLYIERYIWEPGPRLNMHLKLFPRGSSFFNESEVLRLWKLFAGWEIALSRSDDIDVFGPYELLNLTINAYGKDGVLIDSPVAPNTGLSRKRGIRMYIIAGTSSLFGVCIILAFFLWYKRYYSVMPLQRRSRNAPRIESFLQKQGTSHPKRYTYSEVRKMTKSFAHKLGQGGYGAVFRGNLPDGREIAVKMLKDTEGDGEEFMNEVASISRTSHVNIVTLLGFCLKGSKRALIYEYMPNGSLERFTFGNSYTETEAQDSLSWERLFEIVIGIARGLEYLHSGCNTCIVHFDIKPQNILLDQDLCPKISDFGLAKLCLQKESKISIIGARGTVGYIAPELFSRNSGAVSTKSDVYSYGMVVLEMAGARKQIDVHTDSSSKYFPQWLYDNLDQFCSPTTNVISSDTTELARKMVIVALWCIQFTPVDRPSMSKVVEMLESNTMDLQLPPKAFWAG